MKSIIHEIKIGKLNFLKIKDFSSEKDTVQRGRDKSQKRREYL